MKGRGFEILERVVAHDGHFQIIRFRLRHARFAGGMGPVLSREVFERGSAVVVLPYDPVREVVVLVEQFRTGAMDDPDGAWLLEPVAGIIEAGEDLEEVARREAREEADLELLDLQPVCTYYVSPGGSTERCHVFVARVDAGVAGGVHGLADEHEDILVHVVPVDEALRRLDAGELKVASTVIALQWLALHHADLRARWRGAGPA